MTFYFVYNVNWRKKWPQAALPYIGQISITSMCCNLRSQFWSLKDQLIRPATLCTMVKLSSFYSIIPLVWKTIRQLFWLHPTSSPRQSNLLIDELLYTFLENWSGQNPKFPWTLVVWLSAWQMFVFLDKWISNYICGLKSNKYMNEWIHLSQNIWIFQYIWIFTM